MSTGKINKNRFVELARLGEIIFHIRDLANLWQIKNPNTLYTALKRYTQQGLLFRIYKGFYSLKPINQLDPVLLGLKALHEYAYISTETVLIQAGVISQNIDKITLISSQSKKFSIGSHHYFSRKLADKFLYQTVGIVESGGVRTATVSRAVADLLYFNSRVFFDRENLINWQEVKEMQKLIGYPFNTRIKRESNARNDAKKIV